MPNTKQLKVSKTRNRTVTMVNNVKAVLFPSPAAYTYIYSKFVTKLFLFFTMSWILFHGNLTLLIYIISKIITLIFFLYIYHCIFISKGRGTFGTSQSRLSSLPTWLLSYLQPFLLGRYQLHFFLFPAFNNSLIIISFFSDPESKYRFFH